VAGEARGIEEKRLTTEGLGDTKPIDGNDMQLSLDLAAPRR
jgi:flagellar motor protein MotB